MPSNSSRQDGEDGYHVVMEKTRPCASQLPPRVIIPRGQPLTLSQWTNALDAEGRVVDEESVKKIVFEGVSNKTNNRIDSSFYLLLL